MIFIDTGAWFALINKNDQWHKTAKNWLKQNKEPLLTSNYVLTETINLVKNKLGQHCALQIGNVLHAEEAAELYWLTAKDHQETWQIFQKYHDKDWSFTDCSSFVVMCRLKIGFAFAFDKHFSQFSGITKVP